MERVGLAICKHRRIILIIAILLLIPSALGMFATRVNYDILVYLPKDIETIQGEKILSKEFEMGGFSMIVVENMKSKDILKLESEIRKLDNVSKVISISDVLGNSIPKDMLPNEVKDKVYKDNSTVMMVTFKDEISSDASMKTIEEIRKITDERCKISGMTAIVVDTKNLSDEEFFMYVVISVILCIIILQIALDSYAAPFFLLLNIGFAILYNMGTNIFLGEVSYITKAISSVLQLGVTTDFAIFLYHSYMQEKKNEPDLNKAMSIAISKTFKSVFASSLTTIAGFLALCSMNLTLGKDIGIVMAKGVFFGVICVVTVLPAMILQFNKLIEKTKHKEILPKFTHIKNFVMKFHIAIIIVFVLLIPFAFYGYTHTSIYYNLDKSLPKDLPCIVANTTLHDRFEMVSVELALVDKDLPAHKANEMIDKISNMDGIEWCLGYSKLEKFLPEEVLPDDLKSVFENDKYQLIILNSKYEMATDELNTQVDEVNKVLKEYDKNAVLVGEGPLMKDLVEISNHDFKSVNIASIGVIFIIMIFVLKSLTLPVILISVIEFAIFINMGIPYYTGTILPFVASIVIGTIQLGATIDYAILITNKYIAERENGRGRNEAIDNSLGTSIGSILISGLCFFCATFGVGVYSRIEMIGSLCTLMARGAIISMSCVIFILPSLLLVFDKIVCKTTIGMRKINK